MIRVSRFAYRSTVTLMAIAASWACSTATYQYQLPIPGDYPQWVYKGSGSFEEDGKTFLVGVGMVGGVKNASMARTTAANRARSEIAKVLEVYSASLMKDYMAATTAGDMTASSEEQHVEQAIKTFSAATLSGVTIPDFWMAPDGTAFARAVLDFSLLPDLVKKADLDDATRDYVRDNAQKAFDGLEKAEACHKVPGKPSLAAVDILLVIDNSGTMSEEQSNLAKNFSSFASNLTAGNLDFQVGIVTTDVDRESTAGRFVGDVKILTPKTAQLEAEFQKNVAVGTRGSSSEKGLESLRLALSNPISEEHNTGFIRDGARLAIIIVSDENDQSPLPVSQYTKFLSDLKGGLKRITFAALVGDLGGCQSANGSAEDGGRYVEAAKTFGEFGIVESICQDDFAKALNAISGEISEATSQCGKN